MFRYNAQRDSGNHKRDYKFYLDSMVPKKCQQKSTSSYKGKPAHHRGHMVPANHMDGSRVSIQQSNSMINVLPQAAGLNTGAWLATEEIVECYRDIDELLVLGGPIWGNDKNNDYFIASHGLATPDGYWKVILRNDRVLAWVFPNSSSATKKKLDNYLASVAEVEKKIGHSLKEIPDYLKHDKARSSWIIPIGCNKS